MKLPDGTVLMHQGRPYDPAQAHEYYVRHRKLKGRPHGGSFTVTTSSGKTVKLSAKQLEQQKAYAAHRVNEIKKNLGDLKVLLREKMRAAQEAEKKSSKPPSLADKAKAAREAEQYRKTHKQELQNKATQAASKQRASGSSGSKSTQKSDTVDSLKKEIATTRDKLKTAVAKQRELATAKKNG
jgi:hypothetical protein